MTSPIPAPPPVRRGFVLAALLSATFMATVDASIVNVALPTLSRELHAPASDTVWVTTAFLLAAACCIPATAALGDRVGRRRLFLVGVPAFTLASVACAAAPTLGVLVAARVAQGVASALVLAVPIPVYRHVVPPERLGSVLGLNAMVVALGTSAGPALGGLLLTALPWPWLFLVNVPVGLTATLLGWRFLPGVTGRGGRFDALGSVWIAAAIASFLLGVRGLGSTSTLPVSTALLAATAVLVVLFVRHEKRTARPVVPPALFRRPFTLAVLTASCSFFGQSTAFVALPFLFQQSLGDSALRSALLFTPWPLVIVLVAPLSGRAADRVDPTLLALLGLTVMAGGLVSLALLPEDASTAEILVRTGLCGLGFAVFQSPNNRDMMSAAPLQHAGSAAGVLNLNRTVSQSTGSGAVSVVFVAAGASAGQHVGLVLALGAAVTAVGAGLAGLRLAGGTSR
ncbi:DHA2 family efflux MFS transporter permease subunit [Kineococcus rhizosphaerae]|uniref:DHA2 family multidrug resistance protein-like MFS transporter n=1 Tax=Kineococcus rhizosphaerae TaxID=559628 RepID=A0A2T0R685_9ACTN|nr:DHA2 family efflux MFS transporter permease subunit [Kineococcus rhizosphaerae]PRY16699.1 DHA2 family multidrug resistance protein-like MFS transporter [Kineococcus rhizosphaerae]